MSGRAKQCRRDHPTVIGIFGPTASGKSPVGGSVAARIQAELVSADALQVYRGLPILTNQSAEPTRLVGIWPLDHEASVGEYAPLAHAAVDEILAAGRTPSWSAAPGSTCGRRSPTSRCRPRRRRGRGSAGHGSTTSEGAAAAHARLAELDPAAAAAVHANDRRRVLRALELAEVGASLVPAEDRLWAAETRHPTLLVGLDVPKPVLERRIEERTRAMFEAGVEDEVRRALAGPISVTARKTLGLDEVATLPREEAIAALVVRTRRYAAYQRKWMRRIPGLVMVDGDRPPGEVADEIVTLARTRERLPRR